MNRRRNPGALAESSQAQKFDGSFLAEFSGRRRARRVGPLAILLGRRKLAELDAHLSQRMLQQGQPPNGVRRILAGLLETRDRFDLLLDAELHHAKMGARGTLIGSHSLARNTLCAIGRSCDGKDECPLNPVGTTLLVF